MSDWEVVPDNTDIPLSQSTSDWEEVQQPNSMQPDVNESFGAALAKSPFRVGEDIYRGGMSALKSIPGYVNSAPNEINGLINNLATHPGHVGKQVLAGLAELGQNLFNTPHDIANYATNRLNLIPQDINKQIQMARMPDSEETINTTFGQPIYSGENLARGLGRNALNIMGSAGIVKQLNPVNLTARSIAKDVVNTEKKQIAKHSNMYNAIWKKADKTGFNEVPYDKNLLIPYRDVINNYYPSKSTKTLNDFISKPTLENAQRAQSDLGNLRRSIEDKARTTPLLGSEKDLYEALSGSEKHIENNMFKNSKGEINKSLKNQYDKVTKSYRDNVVPYKYNPSIQAYKNKEMLPNELVNSLSHGEFAAKKGSAHPAIILRNKLFPTAKGIGLIGGGTYLYNQMFGNSPYQH